MTIKERAERKFGNGSCASIQIPSYIKGATDQRTIDIENACEWLKANNGKRFNGFEIVYTQGFITEFRNYMEGKV